MAIKNLLRRKVRSLLTLIGIVIGVTAIVALGALANGLQEGYVKAFAGSGADLVLTQKGAWNIPNSSISEDLGPQLASIEGVQSVTGMLMGVVRAETTPFFYVFGYAPRGFAIQRYRIVEGQSLAEANESPGAVIVGRVAANGFNRRVGETLRLKGKEYPIVGLYETGAGLDDGGAVISIADAQTLFRKPGKVGLYMIKLNSPDLAERVRTTIEGQFEEVQVATPGDLAGKQQTIQVIRGLAWALAFLSIIIGSIGMVNTVIMSVFEQTREIGTLRALGWSAFRVLQLVLAESVVLAAIGGVLGSMLGALIVVAMGRVPLLSFVKGGMSPGLLVLGLGTALALGLLGGLYPAWRASRLLPVEALRYEAGAEVFGSRLLPPWPVFRSLWRRRTRSILSIAGLALGITAIIVLGGVADGYIKTFTDLVSGTQADLVVRQTDSSDLAAMELDERLGSELQTVPGVEAVAGIVYHAAQTDKIPTFFLQGYALDEFGIQRFRIVKGQGLAQKGQIIVGRKAAETFDIHIGETVQVSVMDFKVVGLYETGVLLEDMNGGVITLRDAQALAGKSRRVTLFGIKLSNPKDAETVRAQIEAAHSDLAVGKSSEFGESLTELQGMQALVSGIWVLAVAMGGLGMMNTLLMSVFERTREVGTLRALGWSRVRVLWMLLKESLVLTLISLAIGSGLAALAGWGFSQLPQISAYLGFGVNLPLLLRALVFALVLSAVGGLYPAWRASCLAPAEALRYE